MRRTLRNLPIDQRHHILIIFEKFYGHSYTISSISSVRERTQQLLLPMIVHLEARMKIQVHTRQHINKKYFDYVKSCHEPRARKLRRSSSLVRLGECNHIPLSLSMMLPTLTGHPLPSL